MAGYTAPPASKAPLPGPGALTPTAATVAAPSGAQAAQEAPEEDGQRGRRAMKKATTADQIGPLQYRVMEIVWASNDSATVHGVHTKIVALDRAAGNEPRAYTTILTVMRNLAMRGFLSQIAQGRQHTFKPLVTRDQVRTTALTNLATTMFAGDLEGLAAYARNVTDQA